MTTTTIAWGFTDTIDLNMTSSAQTFIAISATAILASDGILTFSALTIGLYFLRSLASSAIYAWTTFWRELRWMMDDDIWALCPSLFSSFPTLLIIAKAYGIWICELKVKGGSLVIINMYTKVLAGRWWKVGGLVESLLFSSLSRKNWLEVWCGHGSRFSFPQKETGISFHWFVSTSRTSGVMLGTWKIVRGCRLISW